MEPFIVKDLEGYLEGLNRIFDTVRIVNPILNRVIHMEKEKEIKGGSSCYEFWDRNILCENCISRDAIKSNSTEAKIESNNNGTHIVMATPILFGGEGYVVEMIKNIP